MCHFPSILNHWFAHYRTSHLELYLNLELIDYFAENREELIELKKDFIFKVCM